MAFRFGFRCRVCSLPAFRNCPQKWTPKRRSGKEVKHPSQKEVQTKGTRTATVTCWGHCCQKKPLQVPLFILMVVSVIRFSTRLEASWHSWYCSYVQEEQPFFASQSFQCCFDLCYRDVAVACATILELVQLQVMGPAVFMAMFHCQLIMRRRWSSLVNSRVHLLRGYWVKISHSSKKPPDSRLNRHAIPL